MLIGFALMLMKSEELERQGLSCVRMDKCILDRKRSVYPDRYVQHVFVLI